MDDLYAVGPPDVLFPALERFWREVELVCQLVLERSKTEVFSWQELEEELPMELTRARLLMGSLNPASYVTGFRWAAEHMSVTTSISRCWM